MTTYTLERTLPDGTVKTQGPIPRGRACGLAAQVIWDNLGATDRAGRKLADTLFLAVDGQHVDSHGYRFRLIPAP